MDAERRLNEFFSAPICGLNLRKSAGKTLTKLSKYATCLFFTIFKTLIISTLKNNFKEISRKIILFKSKR